MQLFFNRTIAIALLTALAIFVGVRGLVPALTKIDSDFPNYFTAAKIVIDGGATERLYDDSWFKTQVQRYEMDSQGKFSPFPPPTALLLTPLAHFEPLTALRWLTVFSLLCLAGTIYLLARTLSWGIVDAAVFVLLSGFAIVNAFRLGQPYILASLLLVLGYRAYVGKKPISAGIWLGVFLPIKYYSATVLLYFALHKNWKVVTAGCAT